MREDLAGRLESIAGDADDDRVHLARKLLALDPAIDPVKALISWRRQLTERLDQAATEGTKIPTTRSADGQLWTMTALFFSAIDELIALLNAPADGVVRTVDGRVNPGAPQDKTSSAADEAEWGIERCPSCGAVLEGGARGLCFSCRGRPRPYSTTIRQRLGR